jgi:hypothetical protein
VDVELHDLLTTDQIAALTVRLREIIRNGYGEVTLRIEGDRVYIVQSVSLNAGRLPNP